MLQLIGIGVSLTGLLVNLVLMNSILPKVKHRPLHSLKGLSNHTMSKVIIEMLHTGNINQNVICLFYECVILFQPCI